jgi:hypothetical protein
VFDDFMNLSHSSYSSEDDDDLKSAKESYCKLLEDAPKLGDMRLEIEDPEEELEKLLRVRDFSEISKLLCRGGNMPSFLI